MIETICWVCMIAAIIGSIYEHMQNRKKQAWLIEQLARPVSVPRQPRERLNDWSKRVAVALDELHEAEHAFIDTAARVGRYEILRPRVTRWALPGWHPATRRVLRARNGGVDVAPGMLLSGHHTITTISL